MKKLYNVSYDLNKAGKDYKGLHDELKRTESWYHLLDSTWLLYTSESASQIWDRLSPHIDTDDHILIIQVVNNYYGWLPQDAWNWITAKFQQPVM
jgi:hypothetical protein